MLPFATSATSRPNKKDGSRSMLNSSVAVGLLSGVLLSLVFSYSDSRQPTLDTGGRRVMRLGYRK